MRRGTTPTNTFNVNIDLREAEVLYVTYEQGHTVVIEKTISDLSIAEDSVSVVLSQEDTLKFNSGVVHIQLRARFSDGTALASNIITASTEQILKDGVI